MDEDIAIIDSNTRNEKIKNFFINNKKKLIILISIIILIIFGYYGYKDFERNKNIELADKYNLVTINFISGNNTNIENDLVAIVNEKDKTYSPLALYFLIDNNIIKNKEHINKLFDVVIEVSTMNKEIKNLVIYKKALFNSEFESENNLIEILKPIINSESIWKSHGLYLMGEYFYSKNQKQKAKEFYTKILTLKNINPGIKTEVQKRIQRDFSE